MMLFPAAVVGFLLFHRRRDFAAPGVWLMLAAGAARGGYRSSSGTRSTTGCRSGTSSGRWVEAGRGAIRWLGPAQFLGSQAGMMFGLWLVAFLAAAWRYRPTSATDPGIRLLWWSAVPVWGVFALASLAKAGQTNWPAPAYVAGFVLAVAWVREQLAGGHSRLVGWCLGVNVVLGLLVVVGVHFPAPFQPLLARIVGPPSDRDPTPIRRLDITARLHGWRLARGRSRSVAGADDRRDRR